MGYLPIIRDADDDYSADNVSRRCFIAPQRGCGTVIRIVLHKDIPNLRNQAVAQVCAPCRDGGFECNRGNLKLTGDVLLLGLGWV